MSLIGVLVCAFLSSGELTQDKVKSPAFAPRQFEFFYSFQVEEVPADAKSMRIWIPVPPNTSLQSIGQRQVEGNLPFQEIQESVFGNRFLLFRLEGKDLTKPALPITVRYAVHRKPFLEATAASSALSQEDRSRFLAPDKMVPIDGKIAAEAQKVAGATEGPFDKARNLFDHIVGSVKYDKTGQGWGRGDAVYACDVRKGNCTDFHSLFIGEARSLGIPARFLMGFSVPADKAEGPIAGYHCWGEFFVEGRGWLPIDASEASKFPDRKDEFFSVLDADRVQFTMGRDIRLPESAVGTVNFLVYPHVEIDGKTHTKIKNQFRFKTIGD